MNEMDRVAPDTIIYAPSGTRRHAILNGVADSGWDYAEWSRVQLFNCFELLFQYGIRHIILPLMSADLLKEATPNYTEYVWDWVKWGIGSEVSLADYERMKCQAHILLGQGYPVLRNTLETIRATHKPERDPYIWYGITPDVSASWIITLNLIKQLDRIPETPDQAVKLLYGLDIPSPKILIGFGKPAFQPAINPPFLIRGEMASYWSQLPGYSLNEGQLQSILHDYWDIRPTWQRNKDGRDVLKHKDIWLEGSILGVGKRLGNFWYPQS